MRRESIWWFFGVGWLAAVAAGFGAWERYDTAAGADRPAAPATEVRKGRWHLSVYVHPHCPCAKATVAELAEVIREVPELVVRVVFVCPVGTPPGWELGRLWDMAAEVDGAELVADVGGTEARRIGAETSGLGVLSDPSGRVVFRGGLTRARGREGESAGRRIVIDWVSGRPAPADAPVFGCPLIGDE